jgi:hypothetical protein
MAAIKDRSSRLFADYQISPIQAGKPTNPYRRGEQAKLLLAPVCVAFVAGHNPIGMQPPISMPGRKIPVVTLIAVVSSGAR